MMETREVNVGARIKYWRHKIGITQDGLAKRANIPLSTISKIESGVVNKPTIQTIMSIAKGLDISIDDLMEMK